MLCVHSITDSPPLLYFREQKQKHYYYVVGLHSYSFTEVTHSHDADLLPDYQISCDIRCFIFLHNMTFLFFFFAVVVQTVLKHKKFAYTNNHSDLNQCIVFTFYTATFLEVITHILRRPLSMAKCPGIKTEWVCFSGHSPQQEVNILFCSVNHYQTSNTKINQFHLSLVYIGVQYFLADIIIGHIFSINCRSWR